MHIVDLENGVTSNRLLVYPCNSKSCFTWGHGLFCHCKMLYFECPY